MKIRGLLYIALLIICIVIRLLTWLPISNLSFQYDILLGSSLAELVFYGILADVLRIGKERIWITVIAWITFIACVAEFIQALTGHRFFNTESLLLDFKILALLKVALYLSILFVRPGPLRILFRWLAIIPVIPFILPHLSYPKHHVPALAVTVADTCITLLQYILLIDIVYRTPELQSAEGIDFP
jgi:hypothetical protein